MKIYFKILLITGGIQVATFIISRIIDKLSIGGGENFISSVGVIIVGILVSTILGIILPLRWYHTKKGKILGIVLLLTNYTWLILAVSVFTFVKLLLDILRHIPDNFG